MTFKTDLVKAVKTQKKIKALQAEVSAFKEAYGVLLDAKLARGEEPLLDLETGEKFYRREGVEARGPHGSLKEEKAIAWFRQAIRQKLITRHAFEKLTKPHNGRKASYIVSK
tara:strand:- start:67 stop:402 length:336 start_codon:yes stop_codon:yes gene_type:complete